MNNTIELPPLTIDDLLSPKFSSVDACAAIGCNTQWLKNMLSRVPPMVALSAAERVAVGDRQYFLFSLRTVIHLALARRLSKVFPLQQAVYLGEAFTRVGSNLGDAFWAEQMIGTLAEGDVYLVARPAEPGPTSILVTRAQARPAATLLAGPEADPSDPVVVLDLSQVVSEVCAALEVGTEGELTAE